MKSKVSAMLMTSGVFFLIFLTIIFYGQLYYFGSQLKFYQEDIDYNKARTMRNIDQNHQLKENEMLTFNLGIVELKNKKYVVKLNSGKIYNLDPVSVGLQSKQ